jgi:hypothetical protein
MLIKCQHMDIMVEEVNLGYLSYAHAQTIIANGVIIIVFHDLDYLSIWYY